jgi:hypothetical protein
MQPSPYDRTMAVLRVRFRRRPAAATGVALACIWLVLNVYQTLAHWSRVSQLGWFQTLTDTVFFCAYGVITVAGLVWLVESVTGEPRP